jgi:hypothetical protein
MCAKAPRCLPAMTNKPDTWSGRVFEVLPHERHGSTAIAVNLPGNLAAGRTHARARGSRVVVVHDDTELVDELGALLRMHGHEVAAFPDPVAAWDALEAAEKTEVLVTWVEFPPGKPHGRANRMAPRWRSWLAPSGEKFACCL